MQPSVCVAIPVKNGRDFLAEAIESVLAQTGVDLAVRVIDNRSDDDSLEIARRYTSDPRVTADRNAVDVFYFGSLNRVLDETDADYFVPFAADDVMLPGNLERKVALLEESGAAFANSRVLEIDGTGARTGIWPADDDRDIPAVTPAPHYFRRLVPTNTVAAQSVVARTSALREIGGFDGRSFYAGDWLTWLRLSLRWPVATVHEPLVAYRRHAESGNLDSNAKGLNGRDVPVTLDRVFLDEAMPAAWQGERDRLVATTHQKVALTLRESGIRRVAQGWAAYMVIGRALARAPEDGQLRGQFELFAAEAGLTPPALPAQAVTSAPETATDAAALGATVDELGPLLRQLVIWVHPDRVDDAMALLEPVFGETALEVEVVPVEDGTALLAPGRLALARWGSELVAVAEGAGVPVLPYAMPDPFAAPPDRDRWETVDAARCLP